MTDYLVTARAEVLYEKVFSVFAKYSRYINSSSQPLECIKLLYDNLASYPDKVILCDNQKTYELLENEIDAYDKIIDSIYYPSVIGA